MPVSRSLLRTGFVSALAFSALLAPGSLVGQNVPPVTFGIGYVTNAPRLLAGAGGYAVFPLWGGLGVYLDAKFDVGGPSREDSFESTLTAGEVGDQVPGAEVVGTEDSWQSFNVALVRPLTPAFMLYLGAGYATRTHYREYRDPEGELGQVGIFWVEVPDEQSNTVNGLFGAFLRMGRPLDFQFGFETAPRGFTVGASLRLPPR